MTATEITSTATANYTTASETTREDQQHQEAAVTHSKCELESEILVTFKV